MTRNNKEYIEYRAVSGVFRTIDPPPPVHSASVSSHRHQRRGVHTRRAVRGWEVNISEDARHWIGLLQYNPSTQGTHLEVWSRSVRCVGSWLSPTHWQRGIKLSHETVKTAVHQHYSMYVQYFQVRKKEISLRLSDLSCRKKAAE
jgi:hypothetical protein